MKKEQKEAKWHSCLLHCEKLPYPEEDGKVNLRLN